MLFVGIPLVVLFGSLGQAESTTLAVATGVIGYAGRMGAWGVRRDSWCVVSPKGTNQTEGVCPGKFQNSPYGPIFLANLLERVPHMPNRGGEPFLVLDGHFGWGRPDAQKWLTDARQTPVR